MAKRNTPSTALFGKNSRFVWGGLIGLGVILAVIAKFSQNIQSPQSVLFSEKKSQVVKPPEDNYADFGMWQRVENFVELFHFAMPDFFSIKTVSEKTQYELESVRTVGTSLIHLSVLPYATFQEQKRVLDAGGEKQFGWTNAYGASVFEYQNDHLTVFVVDKEKKEVVKLVADESKFFPVTRNIARTFESTKPEKDIHGPWYVNFAGKYKLRYTTDYEVLTPSPFTDELRLKVKFKDETKSGMITLSVGPAYGDFVLPDGSEPTNTKKIKVDSVEATVYEFSDQEPFIIWEKENARFELRVSGDSAQTNKTLLNLTTQMLVSFRFLTAQEAME